MNSPEFPVGCPCGSGRGYDDCCGPYHRGESLPPSAGALMRSRYSAYVVGASDYLYESWHPSTRPGRDQLEGGNRSWLGLVIHQTVAGGPDDAEGIVEFTARYPGGEMRERSRFCREGGRWFYLDGEVSGETVRVGRNDPCPCGSGRKYKKCCGK